MSETFGVGGAGIQNLSHFLQKMCNTTFVIEHQALVLEDIVTHQLPILLLLLGGRSQTMCWFPEIMVAFAYMVLVDIQQKYGLLICDQIIIVIVVLMILRLQQRAKGSPCISRTT